MKKTTIFLAILSISMLLSSCTIEEDDGKSPTLRLSPAYVTFENRRDTAIVTAQRSYFSIGRHFISKDTYISKTGDTLSDGWIKIITLSDLKQIKVIVSDNDTGSARYYIVSIDGRNNGDDISIFQSEDYVFGKKK